MHILFLPIFLQGAIRQFFNPIQFEYSFQYHLVQLAVSCFATALLNFTRSKGLSGTLVLFSSFRVSTGLIIGFMMGLGGRCSSSFHSLSHLPLISYQTWLPNFQIFSSVGRSSVISAYILQQNDNIQSHRRNQKTCFDVIIRLDKG